MQAAQHSALRARMIVLHKGQIYPCFPVALNLKRLLKEASIITKYPGFDYEYVWQFRFDNVHTA
jgi:hypothetical protein